METVQSSFLRFRPSGDSVLPLSMRYASLALRRDMLRVGCLSCNSSGISSMLLCDRVARLIKVGRDCCYVVCVECCLLPVYVL